MDTKVVNVEGGVSKGKLMQDLHIVATDAEDLLRVTAGQAGEKISIARERIQESLAAAKERLAVAQESLVKQTKQTAKVTDEYVHDNPWKSVGMAAGVGLIIGMLISRSR